MSVNYDKIRNLVYTEKSNKQLAEGKYHFSVCSTCDKTEIASLIKKTFGVEVVKVNIVNTPVKTKVFKGIQGTIGSYKKAIVTLKKGQTINFG